MTTLRAVLTSLLLALPAGAAEPPPLVVYVVRHAEKSVGEGDVPLSEAGAARAAVLARLLSEVPLTGVHSTKTARTVGTVTPAAAARHLEVALYDHVHPELLVAALKAAGGSHLVVGHSNTVPALVEALGGGPQSLMTELEFDRLTLVVVPAAGPAISQTLRYGAPPGG